MEQQQVRLSQSTCDVADDDDDDDGAGADTDTGAENGDDGGAGSSRSFISASRLDHIISRKHYYVNKAAASYHREPAPPSAVATAARGKRSLSVADLSCHSVGAELPMPSNTRCLYGDHHDGDGGYGNQIQVTTDGAINSLPLKQRQANDKTEKGSSLAKNNHHLATCGKQKFSDEEKGQKVQEACNRYARSANKSPSNCASSKRSQSALVGLIELFEQKVRLSKALAPSIERAAESGRRTNNKSNKTRLISCKANRINKPTGKSNMRDIITPVSYEQGSGVTCSSGSGSGSGESVADTERDSLDELELISNSSSASAGSRTLPDKRRQQRISVKGVPVLPAPSKAINKKPSVRRLTKTNWQPPTDARKYDRLLTPTDSQPPNCRTATSAAKQHKRTPNPANLSPCIVKHQLSSSRRLLNQLARARKQPEPSYQVKRPEKVPQVEELIEQLERAVSHWQGDESLLERADRRDWPIEYHARYARGRPEAINSEATQGNQKSEHFGQRSHVPSIEKESVERSHKQMMNIYKEQPFGESGCRSDRPRRSYLPSAFADRYHDDLAVRRLSNNNHSQQQQQQIDDKPCQTMSYLLCSNAYTPASSSPTGGPADFYDSLERRVRADDLQFRQYRAKNRLDPHEPPFGIPRQVATASVHSSASHYLRQQPHEAGAERRLHLQQVGADTGQGTAGLASATRVCCCSSRVQPQAPLAESEFQSKQKVGLDRRKTDSRVSFLDDRAGGASADSGLVIGSPALSDLTRGSRLATPTRVQPDADDDDAAEEIDLDELSQRNLEHLADGDPRRCESPAVERFRAELRATPVRRRPKINIERPRAKSPLLRVSNGLPVGVGSKTGTGTGTGTETDTRSSEQRAPSRETEAGDDRAPVQIRCYEDSARQTSEMEYCCDFPDEDNDEEISHLSSEARRMARGKEVRNTHRPRYITTNLDALSAGEQSQNESSIERLNYRDAPISRASDEGATGKGNGAKKKDGPIFSISQYKPLNRPDLKIL